MAIFFQNWLKKIVVGYKIFTKFSYNLNKFWYFVENYTQKCEIGYKEISSRVTPDLLHSTGNTRHILYM